MQNLLMHNPRIEYLHLASFSLTFAILRYRANDVIRELNKYVLCLFFYFHISTFSIQVLNKMFYLGITNYKIFLYDHFSLETKNIEIFVPSKPCFLSKLK